MKATELRIGNYVIEKGKIKPMYSISNHNAKDYSRIEPIPLTEEWLKKLGFKLVFAGQGDGYIYEYGELCKTLTIHSRDRNKFLYSTFNSCEKHIQYVHQLQNLYFALTNEELTNEELILAK